jgi:hypothetical protein
MSYELQRGNSLGENLRRICRKEIDAALGAVRGEIDDGDSAVQETRKYLKRARAVVRKEIGRLFGQAHDLSFLGERLRDQDTEAMPA